MLIKEIRLKTKLTQKEFANRFKIPLSTLRKWEQGDSSPSSYFINLLISTMPEFNKSLHKIEVNGKIYSVDEEAQIVYDAYNNSMHYDAISENISEKNIATYIDDFFNDFYKLQNTFNKNIEYDPLKYIVWERDDEQ